MHEVNLYLRKTHRYNDGWADCDEHEYLGNIKVTPAKVIEPAENEDYSVGPTLIRYARLPAGADSKKYRAAIRDTLGGSNCRHEYDCCGCQSHRVFTRMLNKRDMLIVTDISYNY